MKRLILHVLTMLVTFAFGIGIDRVIWRRAEIRTATPQDVVRVAPNIIYPHAELVAATPVVTTPPLDASPPINMIRNYITETFNPSGAYFIIGSRSSDFNEIDSLDLQWSPATEKQSAIYEAGIYTHKSDWSGFSDHPATFGYITEKRLFFVATQTAEADFEYRFDGEFIRRDFETVSGKNKPVLRGTLTKVKNGQKIAETEVSFRFQFIGC